MMDLAERGRHFDRENDAEAEAMFPWREMTPEEWVAWHGHTVGACSLHLYRYRDRALGDWVRRMRELLSARDEEIEGYRRRYLTAEEPARVRAVMAEQDRVGF